MQGWPALAVQGRATALQMLPAHGCVRPHSKAPLPLQGQQHFIHGTPLHKTAMLPMVNAQQGHLLQGGVKQPHGQAGQLTLHDIVQPLGGVGVSPPCYPVQVTLQAAGRAQQTHLHLGHRDLATACSAEHRPAQHRRARARWSDALCCCTIGLPKSLQT